MTGPQTKAALAEWESYKEEAIRAIARLKEECVHEYDATELPYRCCKWCGERNWRVGGQFL